MKRTFQLRIPADVHAKLKAAAKGAGLSLNQLIAGVCQAYVVGCLKVEVREAVAVSAVEK